MDEPSGEDPDGRNRSRAHGIERGLEAALRRARGQETTPKAGAQLRRFTRVGRVDERTTSVEIRRKLYHSDW